MRELGEAKDWQDGAASPIEDRMIIAVCDVLGWMVYRKPRLRYDVARLVAKSWLPIGHFMLVPQCGVGRFQIDLVVFGKAGPHAVRAVALECDGKDFHSSPAQRSRDEKRDAEILGKTGLEIKRFTGSNIRKSALYSAKLAMGELLEFVGRVPLNEPTDAVDGGEWLDDGHG